MSMLTSPLTRRVGRLHDRKVHEYEPVNLVEDTPKALSHRRKLLRFCRVCGLGFSSASNIYQVIRVVVVLLVVIITFPLSKMKAEHRGVTVHYPRIVFYENQPWLHDQVFSKYEADPMLRVNPGEETKPQPDQDGKEKNCIPMKAWQTQMFPTCNTVHEIALESSCRQSSPIDLSRIASSHVSDTVSGASAFVDSKPSEKNVKYSDDNAMIIGAGWFRHAWKLTSSAEKAIFKTLRYV